MSSDAQERVTTTIRGERLEFFRELRETTDAGSDAAVMREIVDRAMMCDEARERADALEDRVADLQRQLAAANQRIDASNELVRQVDERRSLERRRREAGILRRARWWVFGMDKDD
jgi:hypothetical protein